MGRERKKPQSEGQRAWAELDQADGGGKAPRLTVPCFILNHPKYTAMSRNARCLLWDIGAQFEGFNNGYLDATFSRMKERGWPSPVTLGETLKELQHFGFIEMTQRGGRDHTPHLFALTWRTINKRENQPLHLPPAAHFIRPSGMWKLPVEPYVSTKSTKPAAPKARHLQAVA